MSLCSVSYCSPFLTFTPLFLTDEAPASCCVVRSLWSILPSHVSLPVLRLPRLVLLCFSILVALWKRSYPVYLPSLSSLLHPSPILIFSCSACCVFKVYRTPPQRARDKCAWAGVEKRGWAGKSGEGGKGIEALLNFRFQVPNSPLSFLSPQYLYPYHNKCHCSSPVKNMQSFTFS